MDILESLRIVFVILQVGALTQWRLERKKQCTLSISHLLEVYAVLTVLVSIGLFIYGLITDKDMNMSNNGIGQTVDSIQVMGIRLAHLAAVSEAFVKRHHVREFYEQVNEIDRIMERSLNIVVDNRKFRRRLLKYGSLLVAVYLGSEFFMLATRLLLTDQRFWSFWFFYIFPFLIVGIRYFQYFLAIWLIRLRFDIISKVLNEVNLTKQTKNAHDTAATALSMIFSEHQQYTKRPMDMENPELKRLLVIRDLYNRLWELCALVNRSYGVSMLIGVANDFVTIVANCYWIFLNFKELSSTTMDYIEIAGSAVWSVPHFMNLLMLAFICERTVQCTTNIALGLHRIQLDSLNDNHNTVIEQFSLQLLHQKVSFSASGFFDINCTLLYTIAGATTTYLIILIQFNMNEQRQLN